MPSYKKNTHQLQLAIKRQVDAGTKKKKLKKMNMHELRLRTYKVPFVGLVAIRIQLLLLKPVLFRMYVV